MNAPPTIRPPSYKFGLWLMALLLAAALALCIYANHVTNNDPGSDPGRAEEVAR